ncbi:uncharacterized protein Eint_041330 [Encephalitozoon intestinalis ATCC 50506]|uniref:4Fe-4S ferredoxin-type domain-containing protein n=1 Tax=Encephalitozoon intestinalis (strain ATCC 50506) TaxID=876142 RepID=E0S6T7_ENCIT|nr:uncharacterized protein Eint_041330 [Encephalitozoon intestinalis ATCC 50506]ADM11422.1 hypothetical protein Eint_041330 [Encephalitozoon intestinalis ATCC 50506]UTX45114.1 hypothetical protein GPK93_04g06520 [Encephalitozoon intestinalis]
MEGCSHPWIDNGACTSCGLCLESDCDNYMASYTFHRPVIPRRMKYFVVDKAERYSRNVESLLGILNVSGYSEEVKLLLRTKDFEHRIGANDKILAITYNVLRRHQYPISYSDLKPLTERTGLGLKRILLREFEYVELSSEYLSRIFSRVRDFCLSQGLKGNHLLEEFLSISKSNKCTSSYCLCIAYFIRDENLPDSHRRLNLGEIISVSSLKRIVKKIQGDLQRNGDRPSETKKKLRIKDRARKYIMRKLQEQPQKD